MSDRPVVFLFHPRTLHEKTYRFYTIPYSVLSAASLIDQEQFEVVVVDDNVERLDDPGTAVEPYLDRLLLVGISAMVGGQLAGGLAFTDALRRRGSKVPVIWGGAAAGTLGELMLGHRAIDHIVQGEGQHAVRAIAEALAARRPLIGIPGLVSSRNGVPTPSGDPAPAAFGEMGGFRRLYPLVDVGNYVNDDIHIGPRTLSYQSALGCKANCGFCAEVLLWGRNPRALPVDIVLADLHHLVDSHQIDGIKFYDAEFFFADRDRALEIVRRINAELQIRWGAAVHPANLNKLTDDELDLLANSGASRFLVGAETAVASEQALIRKRVDPDAVLRNAHRCADRGIHVCFTFVTGYPGSPPSAIDATLEFAEQLAAVSPLHEVKVHLYLPYPGTPLFPRAVEAGFVAPTTVEGWSDLDYYERTTPWVDDGVQERITRFNEWGYPYFGVPDKERSFT